jgi:4-hydroxy-tetrahydrodipicolinate synthase
MSLPRGVVAASVTPFRADGSIHVPLFAEHTASLLRSGCDAVLLFGTTGEGLSLTAEERRVALEQVVDHGLPPGRLLVGTGSLAFPDLVELTRAATARGVGGVLVPPPFHIKAVSDAGVYRTYDELVQRVGDADLRLYAYHFPQLTGVEVSFTVLEELRRAYPGQVAGVKDSSGEWDHTETLCHQFPDLDVYAGTERLLRPILDAGGAGCISATVNLTAPLAAAVRSGWQAGDDVAALQDDLATLRAHIASFPMIPALKTLLAHRSGRDDWLHTRPPLPSLPDPSLDSLAPIDRLLDETLAAHDLRTPAREPDAPE